MPKEISTYFGYRDGYDPRVLRLGNMSLDYVNPRMREPYIHEEISASDLPRWTTSRQEEDCYMTRDDEEGYSFGFGLQDLLTFDATHSSGTYKAIVGERGSEVELIEPQSFFTDCVLNSDKARLWLQTRLSVIRKWEIVTSHLRVRPRVWLLIGLYTMESSTTCTITKKTSNHELGAAVPVPDPSGLAAILQLNVGGKAQINSASEITAGAKILTPRVWAAKWQALDAKFVNVKRWTPSIPHQLRLVNTYSLQQVRASDEVLQAEVKLGTKTAPVSIGMADELFNDNHAGFWEEFDEEVKDLAEELVE